LPQGYWHDQEERLPTAPANAPTHSDSSPPQSPPSLTTPRTDRQTDTVRSQVSEMLRVISANRWATSKSAVFLLLVEGVCSHRAARVSLKLGWAVHRVTGWVGSTTGEQDVCNREVEQETASGLQCGLMIPQAHESSAPRGFVWENVTGLCLMPALPLQLLTVQEPAWSGKHTAGQGLTLPTDFDENLAMLNRWVCHLFQHHLPLKHSIPVTAAIVLLLSATRASLRNHKEQHWENPRNVRNFEVGLGSCEMFLFLSFKPFSPLSGIHKWLRKAENQLAYIAAVK